MEIGSGFLTDSVGSNPSSSPPSHESINGLKFGHKIYFEDVAVGPLPNLKSGPGSSPSSSSRSGPPGRKVHGGGGQGQGQPPRCQVEGCTVDLSDAKAYYSRHKVCGMHSKSPMVIVAGLEQRFCQQCSRFHQLPEFDQGKRSCRRRLAGHNERRRKPPPGSLLSSRYGRLPPTVFDSSNRATGFLLDFSTYPRVTGRDSWPTARSSGNQIAATGRSIPHPWQSSLQNPPSDLYLQVSAGGSGCPSSGIPSGECFTDGSSVADSSCALSLLSNQPWGSRNRASGLGAIDLVNADGAPATQTTAPPGAAVNQYQNPSWGFKFNDAGSVSHEVRPDLVLGHISQPLDGQFSSELESSQQGRRQYMELDHSRAYGTSTQQMHWSL